MEKSEQGRPGVREDASGGVEEGSQTLIDANGNKILASELLSKGKEQQAKFLQDLRDVAEETGLTYDPAYEGGSLKSMGRLIEKAGTGVQISDVLRYELTHANPTAKLQDVVAAMKKRGYEVWKDDITNLFDDPEPGYKHIAIKFTTGTNDPVVKELQILQPYMAKIKHKYGWDYYKVDRELKIVIESGLVDREPLEKLRRELNTGMNRAYSFAFGLDNPTLAAPILAKVSIDSSESGEAPTSLYNFSNSSKEALVTLRNPASTSLRNSAISSTVDSLVSGLESIISKPLLTDIIQQNARTVFDEGSPLPINQTNKIEFSHTLTYPEPETVKIFRDAVQVLNGERVSYANQVIDWVLGREVGQKPEAPDALAEKSVEKVLAPHMDAMRATAVEMTTAHRIDTSETPGQGLYVAKVYRFRHGDTDIVSAVYKDGVPVAYLPDNYEIDAFEANKRQARVLGLSPDDPNSRVYEIDGEVRRSDGAELFKPVKETPEFIRWWSWNWARNKPRKQSSVVIGANGKPLEVYHGTPGEMFVLIPCGVHRPR